MRDKQSRIVWNMSLLRSLGPELSTVLETSRSYGAEEQRASRQAIRRQA